MSIIQCNSKVLKLTINIFLSAACLQFKHDHSQFARMSTWSIASKTFYNYTKENFVTQKQRDEQDSLLLTACQSKDKVTDGTGCKGGMKHNWQSTRRSSPFSASLAFSLLSFLQTDPCSSLAILEGVYTSTALSHRA